MDYSIGTITAAAISEINQHTYDELVANSKNRSQPPCAASFS